MPVILSKSFIIFLFTKVLYSKTPHDIIIIRKELFNLMAEPYNFDNRLIGMSLIVANENYINNLLKINGIYYRVNQKINIGDHITIKKINGNMLSIQKLNNQEDIHICWE